MEKDDFDQWKDSYATQWVLNKLATMADNIETAVKEELFRALPLSAPEFDAVSRKLADDRGYVRALRQIVELELEEIHEPEQLRDSPDRI